MPEAGVVRLLVTGSRLQASIAQQRGQLRNDGVIVATYKPSTKHLTYNNGQLRDLGDFLTLMFAQDMRPCGTIVVTQDPGDGTLIAATRY